MTLSETYSGRSHTVTIDTLSHEDIREMTAGCPWVNPDEISVHDIRESLRDYRPAEACGVRWEVLD